MVLVMWLLYQLLLIAVRNTYNSNSATHSSEGMHLTGGLVGGDRLGVAVGFVVGLTPFLGLIGGRQVLGETGLRGFSGA